MSQIEPMTGYRKPPETTRAEAAAWIAKLHGPQRSPELEAGLQRWLAESESNKRAFERMTEAWEDATSVSIRHFPRVRDWRTPVRRPWVVAAAFVLLMGVMGVISWAWWNEHVYTTDIGELRTVQLADGSRVSLNSASRLVVDYDREARRLRLERGEAFFEVAPDPRNPFIVLVGKREVVALGTSFSVRYDLDRIAIVLVDGKVEISPSVRGADSTDPKGTGEVMSAPSQASSRPFALSPGQRLTLAKNNDLKIDAPHVEALTAWRRGEVVLEKTTLTAAVEEMNRYDKVQLTIDDPSIGHLLLSGVYRTGDSAGFARALEAVHGVAAVQENGQIHLRDATGAAR